MRLFHMITAPRLKGNGVNESSERDALEASVFPDRPEPVRMMHQRES